MKAERGDPRHPEATALLQQSHAMMQEMFMPEENYFLDIDALCESDISFFVAKEAGRTFGTAALACKDGYGELKSMFVDPDMRGRGVADVLIQAVETEANALGLSLMRLETGHILTAAVKLYTRHGYAPCPRFGDYLPNTSSLYMEKQL